MKLIAFDGDDTLWEPLDGVNLSDRTPTDDVGWPRFAYTPIPAPPGTVKRDDGARFRLRPEAEDVLKELKKRGVLLGVISYNHVGNVRAILGTFNVLHYFDYIVAEWHSNKDRMLARMLEMARKDGRHLEPGDLILVDDDPAGIYRGQCERMGAGFACFGSDIHSLWDVLDLLDNSAEENSAR
jgi:magnesium-dependent phosphatase-1